MEMPVAIKQAINICAGQEVYKINVYVSEETYEVRRDVRKKCGKSWMNHHYWEMVLDKWSKL